MADYEHEHRFHVDGPHTPERIGEAGDALAHVVRYLNHATLAHRAADALPEPADVARLLGDVELALQRLPQLLGQVAARLRRMGWAAGRVDEDQDVHNASMYMVRAAPFLDQAANDVGRAHTVASRLELEA